MNHRDSVIRGKREGNSVDMSVTGNNNKYDVNQQDCMKPELRLGESFWYLKIYYVTKPPKKTI